MVVEDEKSLNKSNSIKRLISFVENLEEKVCSLENIHQKLNEFLGIVSSTHQTIEQELLNIKFILNEQITNEDEFIPIDSNKSQWDEDDEQIQSIHSMKIFNSKSQTNLNPRDEQKTLSSTHRPDRSSLCSASSYESSSTNSFNNDQRPTSSTSKRSSNLKKSDQSSTRVKSPKSVTFSFDENDNSNLNLSQVQPLIEPISEMSAERITSPILPKCDLIADLFKEHHHEVTNKENIGFKLGNALTNVRIHEIEAMNGDYLRLLNISNSDDYDLGGHFLQQNIACVPISRFRFPFNTIIRAGQTVTIYCGSLRNIEPQPPHIFLWKEQRRWQTGPECVTVLAKPTGQAIAWARSSNRLNSDQSSSDILYLHSKSHLGTSDVGSFTPNSLKSRSRLSAFQLIGNHKPPFAHSPGSSIHPDHNGGTSNLPNDLRSPINPKSGMSQLLNRPKSSPFASHKGCKQDLISLNFLRNEQSQGHKQSTLKT